MQCSHWQADLPDSLPAMAWLSLCMYFFLYDNLLWHNVLGMGQTVMETPAHGISLCRINLPYLVGMAPKSCLFCVSLPFFCGNQPAGSNTCQACWPLGIPAVEPMLQPCQAVNYCDLIYLGPPPLAWFPPGCLRLISSHMRLSRGRVASLSQTLDDTGAPELLVTWTAGHIARQSL